MIHFEARNEYSKWITGFLLQLNDLVETILSNAASKQYMQSTVSARKTSKAFKECAAGENVTTLHHKPYTDKTLHDYSYEKAAQVFEDNVGYTGQE